jgi:hypothetical protein
MSSAATITAAQPKERSYALLKVHIFLLTLSGWAAIAAGALWLLAQIRADAKMIIGDGLLAAGVLVAGICLLAFSELLQLAIHVEANTRR